MVARHTPHIITHLIRGTNETQINSIFFKPKAIEKKMLWRCRKHEHFREEKTYNNIHHGNKTG